MKKINLSLLLLVWALFSSAQTNSRPYWITQLPSTGNNSNYYYRVTQGDGVDYDKAYAKAFARAILESSWKLGVEVSKTNDLQSIEKGITENVKVADMRMKLPMNKVCEYTEKLEERRGVRVFMLWQVAKYGNVLPNFEEFTKCDKP